MGARVARDSTDTPRVAHEPVLIGTTGASDHRSQGGAAVLAVLPSAELRPLGPTGVPISGGVLGAVKGTLIAPQQSESGEGGDKGGINRHERSR